MGVANHLALIAYFISYEKWEQREKSPSKAHLHYEWRQHNIPSLFTTLVETFLLL